MMGVRTRVSLVIYNFVFLFIHTLSFMNDQSIPVAGIHLFLQQGLGCYRLSPRLSMAMNTVGKTCTHLLTCLWRWSVLGGSRTWPAGLMQDMAATSIFLEQVGPGRIAQGISGYMLWPAFRQRNQVLNKERLYPSFSLTFSAF